ncbi:MAG: amidase family protein [Nanoarchaeota archaeon]|nr:amidase family protein [Nanoarchaeota archaeon]
MSINEFSEKVRNKEIDVIEHIHKVIEETKKINKEYNYFNNISEELALKQAKALSKNPKGKLAGIPLAVKDSICVKNVESPAGSSILKGYVPLFNATCVQQAIDEGAIVIGKTSQDEFGFGAFSVNVGLGFKIPKNPFNREYATGGSSGGAAGIAQKSSFPLVSYGESTGGSIASPASLCGVYGLCPTYGLVSRYGLIDYGNSFDKVGPISKNINDLALSLEVMSGYDKKDSTSLDIKNGNYSKSIGKDIKGLKIGVLKEGFNDIDPEVKEAVWRGIKELEQQGAKYEEVSTPLTVEYGIPSYYILAPSEASTNLAKLCGMRYGETKKLEGSFNDYFTKVRSENFGEEAKRRIILGTFARMAGYRDAYYLKAAKVRTKIIEEYKKVFKKVDVLVSPTVPFLPKKFSEIEKMTPLENYLADILLVGPNLAGMPHINVPVGFSKEKMPIGMMLIGDHLQEEKLIQAASAIGK